MSEKNKTNHHSPAFLEKQNLEISNEEKILSNDYADLIQPVLSSAETFQKTYADYAPQTFGGRLGMIHVPRTDAELLRQATYAQTPKLYTLLDTVSLESSGISRVQSQTSLGYQGENVLIGLIDTGIDYTLECFRNADGSSRILGLWDQTIVSEAPPETLSYGTAYTREQIDAALQADDPLSIVPSFDENGHGTFLAGIAAGGQIPSASFSGAAPRSDLAVVKLKPAKEYLREFDLIPDSALAYQETDIMMGILYLVILSIYYEKPVVICLSLGTNQGDHNGNSALDRLLTYYIDYQNCFYVCAAGNEAGKGHHAFHSALSNVSRSEIELNAAESEPGFLLELWADAPSLFRLEITSPLGETAPAVLPRPGLWTTYRFVAESSALDIRYVLSEDSSGAQLVLIRFLRPTPGIWRLTISSDSILGDCHLWLPVSGFVSADTVFLSPDPDTTVTGPGNTEAALTMGGYDAYSQSLYLNSSRGYTRSGGVKPDLTAPAVNVYGPAASPTTDGKLRPSLNPYVRKTGTSCAAALTAGAIALLINWIAERGTFPFFTNRAAKSYLILGAGRPSGLAWPNREWGYGQLDLYGVFEALIRG